MFGITSRPASHHKLVCYPSFRSRSAFLIIFWRNSSFCSGVAVFAPPLQPANEISGEINTAAISRITVGNFDKFIWQPILLIVSQELSRFFVQREMLLFSSLASHCACPCQSIHPHRSRFRQFERCRPPSSH